MAVDRRPGAPRRRPAQSGTCLLAKSSYAFNAARVEGDTLPERPEPPGLVVRLEGRLITQRAEPLTPDAAIDLPVAPEQRGSRTPQDPSC